MAARFLGAVFSSFLVRILIGTGTFWHRILISTFLSAGHSYWHRILFTRAFLSAGHSFGIAFFSAGHLIGIVFFSAGHSFLDCIRPALHSIGRGFGEQGILSWNAFNLQGIL